MRKEIEYFEGIVKQKKNESSKQFKELQRVRDVWAKVDEKHSSVTKTHSDLKAKVKQNDETIREASHKQIEADNKIAETVEKLVQISQTHSHLKSEHPTLENQVHSKTLTSKK